MKPFNSVLVFYQGLGSQHPCWEVELWRDAITPPCLGFNTRVYPPLPCPSFTPTPSVGPTVASAPPSRPSGLQDIAGRNQYRSVESRFLGEGSCWCFTTHHLGQYGERVPIRQQHGKPRLVTQNGASVVTPYVADVDLPTGWGVHCVVQV